MTDFERRDINKIIAGTVAALGALGSVACTPTSQANSASASSRSKLVYSSEVPLVPALATLMPEDRALMDQLATEFIPVAASLTSPKAYWLGLNGWMTDRLSGPIMDGNVSVDELKNQAWAIYATSYWGGMELRENWGMPPVIQRLGITMQPPYAEVQQGIIDKLELLYGALAKGGDHCIDILPGLMRDGMIHMLAYNAGVQVLKTEEPPVGHRRPHRKPKPGALRINGRDFMRVDYDLPTPYYLKVWRSAFEGAVTAHPDAYEQVITGKAGEKNLRDVWKNGVAYGNTTWGGDAQDNWTDEYFDESIRWSSTLNFGLEVVALAAFVAILNRDAEAARRAVMGYALYAGATPGWLVGLLHTEGKLPQLTRG